MASFAVEEWYKEWYNYSKRTHKWNGNIFHDEQIGHFLQVYESQNIKKYSTEVMIRTLSLKIFLNLRYDTVTFLDTPDNFSLKNGNNLILTYRMTFFLNFIMVVSLARYDYFFARYRA